MPNRRQPYRLLILTICLLPVALATAAGAPAPDRIRQLSDLAAVEPGFALLLDGQAKGAYYFFEAFLDQNPNSQAARVGMIQAANAFPDLWPECLERFPPTPTAATAEDLVGNLEVALLIPRSDWPTVEFNPGMRRPFNRPSFGRPASDPPQQETAPQPQAPQSADPPADHRPSPNRPRTFAGPRIQVAPAIAVLEQLEAIEPDNIWTLFGRARLDMLLWGGTGNTTVRVQVQRKWTMRVRERTENWHRPPIVLTTIEPLLNTDRGCLLFWNYYLTDLTNGSEAHLADALQAAYANPSSPLAPKLLYEIAQWELKPQRRWELLSEITNVYPHSPIWDNAQLDRAYMLHDHKPKEALALAEQIFQVNHATVARRTHNLAGDLLLRLGDPQGAIDHYSKIEREWNVPMNTPIGNAFGDLGDWAAAEDRFRKEALRLSAEKTIHTLTTQMRVQVLLADAVAFQGRYQEALQLFDSIPAFVEGFPEPARPDLPPVSLRPAYIQTVLHLFGFPIMAGSLLIVLTMSACLIAVAIWIARIRPILPFLAISGILAVCVATLQTIYSIEFHEIDQPALIAYISSSFLRNFLLVGAGAYLLHNAGFRLNNFLQRPAHKLLGHLAWLGELVLALGLMTGWSVLLYQIQTPELGTFFLRMADIYRGSEFSVLLNHQENLLGACLLVTVAAINEEILFRTFLLGVFLSLFQLPGTAAQSVTRPGLAACALAILATSLFWALPHAGMVQPEWWKMLQVSGLGIILGILGLRRGPAATIVAHITFNLAAVLLTN